MADGRDEKFDAERFVNWYPPGHFYSPIPDYQRIVHQQERIFNVPDQLAGIRLREAEQVELFEELARLARGLGIPQDASPSHRYHSNNLNYGIGDALMLGAFLRHVQPTRYLEVGSGWSTALAMDVNEHFLDHGAKFAAIEPYPQLLKSLLRPHDDIEIIDTPVEDVPLERFQELEANDVLFIDSTHVVKIGSDAHYLFNQVVPAINIGVYVHVHDIFWPFEYPRTWIDEGRAWNENYLLQAFLAFNDSFEIVFFNTWFAHTHRPTIERLLPAMMENPGGAIWLRRVR